MKKFEFHILMGLPGSGKTYWSQYFKYKINFDECLKLKQNPDYLFIETMCGWDFSSEKTYKICIDGLLLTENSLRSTIELIEKYLQFHVQGKYDIEYVIHKWNDDRETCKKNDILRCLFSDRKYLSSVTIDKMKFDDISDIKLDVKFKIVHHEVPKLSIIDFANEETSYDF